MEGRAPRFPDPTLEAIANEFVEVLRVKRDAEEKLVELFNKFAEEFVGYEQRFSDQEIRAITEEIEAMRAMIATRAEPSRSWSRGSISPRRPPRHTSCRTLRTSTRDTCTGSSATSTMIRCALPPAITSIYGPLWHAAAIRGTSCGGGKRRRQRRPRDFDSRLPSGCSRPLERAKQWLVANGHRLAVDLNEICGVTSKTMGTPMRSA
jgi:hypothetical protein